MYLYGLEHVLFRKIIWISNIDYLCNDQLDIWNIHHIDKSVWKKITEQNWNIQWDIFLVLDLSDVLQHWMDIINWIEISLWMVLNSMHFIPFISKCSYYTDCHFIDYLFNPFWIKLRLFDRFLTEIDQDLAVSIFNCFDFLLSL